MRGISIVHATATILLMSFWYIFSTSFNTEAFDEALIFTGRLGLLLFVMSFGASKFHAIFKTGWSRQILKYRRHLGIACALTMFIHVVWIYAKALALPEWWMIISQYEKITGIITLFVISVMGLTSNNLSLKMMGLKNWKRLHLIGGYLALYAFAMEYLLLFFPTAEGGGASNVPLIAYLLLMLVLTVVIARLWKSALIKFVLQKKESSKRSFSNSK
mgnify:FL=1